MHRCKTAAAAVLVAAAACSHDSSRTITGSPPPERPALAQTYRPSGHMAAGDVFVHLFEWRWADIAAECENVLGPAGFKAVQISPPEEHSITPNHDWSERYQPVSYSIAHSRSGTQVEFVDMVNRCNAVGVGIIADAVINHMTNYPSPGVGSNGTAYSKYNYPGPPPLYTPSDFHTPCQVTNYQDAANVQDCELLGLPDLNTGLPTVRQKIADYLVMLTRLGVAGFRIDAAKHIQQVELNDILARMNDTLAADGRPRPYVFLEVIGSTNEALSPQDYFGEGYSSGGAADITEFTFTGVGNKFRNINGEHISQLNPNGPPGNQFSAAAWGLMPSDKAVVFLENHDTQHNCGLSYRDGNVFRNANVWMLAQPYGYPSILSSYVFVCPTENSMGPPSDPNGWTLPVTCASSIDSATAGHWVCEHRDPAILKMIGFRHVVAGTDITHWWDNGTNAIAFSRGDKGFIAINNDTTGVDTTVTTGMAAGTYLDLIAGKPVQIDSTGSVHLTLPKRSAIAIDTATRQ